MKWYKLYLETFYIRDNLALLAGPLKLRALIVLALARRDAAANLLRSRDDFYAELKRLSGVPPKPLKAPPVTISKILLENAIATIKVLRELAFDKLVPFHHGLKECKDIYDQVRNGKPYSFTVKSQHRDEVVAKLRAAGAVVE